LLIIVAFLSSTLLGYSQERIVRVDNSLESPVTYSCADSIYANLQTKIVFLYGEAIVQYEGIELTADYIEMDLEKKTVTATYTTNEEGERIGIPKFTEGSEELTASSLKYNFETEKAYIQELDTKQEENYLHMTVAKKQANDEIHFLQGRFTTCDLEDPHFHFQLSKAVLVPEKRIVTGPVNLWIRGVPTPLGLPFSFIPTSTDQKKTGILFPQIVPFSNWGFGLQDLGYYFPLKKSDNIQTTLYGSLYSRGTFGIRSLTEYKKKYKYTGQLNVAFNRFKNPFPSENILEKIVVQWNHRQEARANPYWNFQSSVNFLSDNNQTTTFEGENETLLNNAFNSDINLRRTFPNLPITMGLKASLKQNSTSNNIDLELPTFTFDVQRFFPFRVLRTNPVGPARFYEKIGFVYNLESQNNVNFADTLLRDRNFSSIQNQFKNGFQQSLNVNTAIPIFDNRATITPSFRYSTNGNFQATRKFYNETTGEIRDSLVNNQFGLVHNASARIDFTSQVYAYYQFVGKNRTKMRHVITPNIGFNYSPNLDVFDTQVLSINNIDSLLNYQPYANSLYRDTRDGESLLLSFNVNNTFEIKRKNGRDTNEEFTKTRIIDALSVRGDYNFLKDSLQFSNLNTALRSSPFPSLNFVASGSFNLYGWDESNGEGSNNFALQENGQLGRFINTQVTTTYIIASKKSKQKIAENADNLEPNWEADYNYYRLNPHEILDFQIPWKVSLTHSWFTRINSDSTQFVARKRNHTQTIAVNADANFTKRWKVGINTNYDIVNQKLVQTRVTLDRNMHCWQLGFSWIPAGINQSFMLRLNATSALFKDAKLELRKPPEFL
jgi:lipopolysaccharide assembly outer membrane protein LptD (OstA)